MSNISEELKEEQNQRTLDFVKSLHLEKTIYVPRERRITICQECGEWMHGETGYLKNEKRLCFDCFEKEEE